MGGLGSDTTNFRVRAIQSSSAFNVKDDFGIKSIVPCDEIDPIGFHWIE